MGVRYNVYLVPSTKTVIVQKHGDLPPSVGSPVSVGHFYHPAGVGDSQKDLVDTAPDNHVVFHHVQEILYKRKLSDGSSTFFPDGITDMSQIKITIDNVYVAVTAISTLPTTVELDLSEAETQQLTNTFTPASPSNTGVTYASSDPTKATVSSTGLITPVAAGTTTITVTSADGGFTDTCVVTVVE